MKSTTNKGFTLIELLVVIAIIGILSGIAIFGLSDARQKGQDAAIKAALGQIPAQAAVFYDDANTYEGLFTAGTNAAKAIADADEISGAVATYDDVDGFMVTAQLVSDTAVYHCVDSEGFNGTTSSATADANGCQ